MDRREFLLAGGVWAAGLKPVAKAAAAPEGRPSAFDVEAAGQAVPLELQLAHYALSLKFENFPAAILHKVKQLLIDTLACAFGAVQSEPAKIAESAARETFTGHKSASIIGGQQLTSIEGAALVNGVLVRYLDLNDIYVGKDPLHPSEIVPAVLALCEEKGSSGREFIEALVAGYEGELRVNDAVSFLAKGYHPLSAGAFIVPLIAGKVWALPPQQIANAIGISGARGLTLFAVNQGSISMMKALGHGLTSADGILAARLAAQGFTGPSGTLDWVATKLQPSQPRIALDLDPHQYRLPFVGLKRFPVQFELQGPVEGGIRLHPLVKQGAGIDSITVRIDGSSISRVAGPEKYDPKTKETADHSLPICLAMALVEGKLTKEMLEAGYWRHPEVKTLAHKIKIEAATDTGTGPAAKLATRIVVFFSDGKVAREAVDIPEGHALRPMSHESLEAKFFEYATPVMGRNGAKKILSLIGGLEDMKDIRRFTAALRGPE